jgi:hypothetical protein
MLASLKSESIEISKNGALGVEPLAMKANPFLKLKIL